MTARDEHLRRRTLRSMGWVGFRSALFIPVQIANLAILSRLLGPDDFGLVAICVVTLGLCEIVSQTGLDLAITREDRDVDALLHPAWTVQVLRGLALAVVVGVASAPIAWVQSDSRLVPLLLVTAIAPAIEGFRSHGPVLLMRDLRQGRLTIYEISVFVLAIAMQIGLAATLRSAWAMVIALVGAALLRAGLSYVVHDYRPRFVRDWSALRKYFRFGVQYNVARTADHMLLVVDRFTIGAWLGTAALGAFERLSVLPQMVHQRFYTLSSATALPSLSAVLSDPVRFRRNARRFVALTVGGFGVAVLALVPLSPWIVDIALGAQYREFQGLLPILLVGMFFRGVSACFLTLCSIHAYGRPQVTTSLVQLIVLAVALPIGLSSGGLVGATWAVVATSGVGTLLLAVQSAALRVDEPPVTGSGASRFCETAMAPPAKAASVAAPAATVRASGVKA